jgi:multiple sugar transport system ATP-binding protein
MLELRTLTKKYGHKTAVNNLSLKTGESEFIVIFGPAGAGKSTTLNLIAGITKPTAGEIWLHGYPLKDVPPEYRNMSMVFENYALYSHLSVFENLAFPLRAHTIAESEIKRQVQEMAEVLQIADFLERRPGFLSGGQRQRVALGRALIRDADVYLLDEPISHLDAKLRHRMRGELKALCAKKESVIVHVTHDYREAMSLSQRMLVINKGVVMQLGTPDEIYHTPANEFVASFVGEPPMSFLEVTYGEQAGHGALAISGLDTAATSLAVSSETEAYFRQRPAPKTLRVGVRASDVTLAAAQDAAHTVRAEVYVMETLGHRDIITAKLGPHLVKVIAAPGMKLRIGDAVWLDISPNTYHLFGDEQAIAHPARQIHLPEGA